MLAGEGISRGVVVEGPGLFPRASCVARFALILQRARHSVRIGMAFLATKRDEFESGLRGTGRRTVAIGTAHSSVSTRQRHARICVFLGAVPGRTPSRNRVAMLAKVLVRTCGKLAAMGFAVAVLARVESRMVVRHRAHAGVAASASHLGVQAQ